MTGRERRTGGERSYGVLLLVCCLVSFACFFGSYLRIPVLPLYAASLGASTVKVGMINASFLLMAGLLSIPLGNLSDRLGRRSLIVAGLAILSGSSFLLRLSIIPLKMMGIYLLFDVGLAAFAQTMMASSAIMGGVIKGVGFAGRFLVSAMFSALMTGGYFLMTRRGNHENLD